MLKVQKSKAQARNIQHLDSINGIRIVPRPRKNELRIHHGDGNYYHLDSDGSIEPADGWGDVGIDTALEG